MLSQVGLPEVLMGAVLVAVILIIFLWFLSRIRRLYDTTTDEIDSDVPKLHIDNRAGEAAPDVNLEGDLLKHGSTQVGHASGKVSGKFKAYKQTAFMLGNVQQGKIEMNDVKVEIGSMQSDGEFVDKADAGLGETEKDYRSHLYTLLKQHQGNLRKLKERQAKYGIDAPVSLLNEIEQEENEIIRIEAELQSLTE